MNLQLIIFLVMVGVFMLCCFLLKLPASIAMMLSAVAGALAYDQSFPIRHFVEGTFSYIDTMLIICTAMIFMKVIEASGALDALCSLIIRRFHKRPAILLIFIMVVIMFPGMITGSSTASVLSGGSIVVPILLTMGISPVNAAAIIAMGALMGMVAPPVNLTAMIIGGGIDTPYVGFELPLILLAFPAAIFAVLYLGLKSARNMDYAVIEPTLNKELGEKYGFRIYLPILLLVVLIVLTKIFKVIPDMRMPAMFLLCAALGLFTGRKVQLVGTVSEAVHSALTVMARLMGVGMFIQIMSLTGVRGFIVSVCLSLPAQLLYLAAAISIPLFGSISSFGAASVLGVPFTLAFLSGDTILTIAGLTMLVSLGDMMPPTAMAGTFAAQVTPGVEKYTPVLKRCVVPMLFILVWGLVFVIFSNQIASLIG